MVTVGCTQCGHEWFATYKNGNWEHGEHRCNANGIIKRIERENRPQFSWDILSL